ncbi:hypothetical protein M2189_003554 [Bradyrhizobium japonicum]|uniref:hypothetical protein n=1 Tax=Bradyrhizobium japonicum TaxID=375 RepID=UPI002166DF86|nr:hypothetical protein [Bradyrhizobium japonicum]MCS3960351.1 hypothetical protein [Bradyrhizobium japonicum]
MLLVQMSSRRRYRASGGRNECIETFRVFLAGGDDQPTGMQIESDLQDRDLVMGRGL